MAGADLANLVNEGALLAARRNHDKIYMSDFEEAKDKVMLGAERKSLVMTRGRAAADRVSTKADTRCARCMVKGNDPMHKVTIVPRGRALGLAFTLPEEDRVSVTREQLEARLVMAYGGRAAEEMVFGREHVTTGAASDIQQATGHGAPLGVAVGHVRRDRPDARRRQRTGNVPRPRDDRAAAKCRSARRRWWTTRSKRVIDEAFAAREEVLTENRALLERIAPALLERETLTREDFAILIRGGRCRRVRRRLSRRCIAGPRDPGAEARHAAVARRAGAVAGVSFVLRRGGPDWAPAAHCGLALLDFHRRASFGRTSASLAVAQIETDVRRCHAGDISHCVDRCLGRIGCGPGHGLCSAPGCPAW